jgi:hypothetical protein
MVKEVYEAFRDAGASEEKATAAAESLVIQFVPRDSTELATRSDISSLREDFREEISGLDRRNEHGRNTPERDGNTIGSYREAVMGRTAGGHRTCGEGIPTHLAACESIVPTHT